MDVHVLYNTSGKLLAIFQPSSEATAPNVELLPGRGQRVTRFEVPRELEGLKVRELHRRISVKLHKDGPRLVVRKR